VLRAVLGDLPPGDVVPLGEIVDRLGVQGLGAALIVLGAASLVPGPAPIFGAALSIIGVGMALGRETIMLPGWLRRRSVRKVRARSIIDTAVPVVTRLERLARPRWNRALHGSGHRIAGIACVVAGILIILPIPFGNAAPATAVVVLGLGHTAGDGLAVVAGVVATVLATVLSGVLMALGYEAFKLLF
jgi:hypothetical protein